MKKFLKACLVVLFVNVFFSSCNSKLSVIKRHYKSGYYVKHTSNRSSERTSTLNSKVSNKKVGKSEYVETIAVLPSKQNTFALPMEASVKKEPVANKFKIKPLTKIAENSKFSLLRKNGQSPVKTIKQKLAKNKLFKSKSSDKEDGLSFFGFVILVILILWLLGFLAGDFGGIIHILLVVALVLLILWLLRII